MMNVFWEFTDQYVLFSEQEKSLLASKFVEKQIPKNTVLVDLGEVAKEVFFVLKGSLRYYYLTEDGREVTGFIFQEKMFSGVHESFFAQLPSNQVFESIEACQVLSLSYNHLIELYREIPRMNEFVRKLLEFRLAYAQKVIASLIINKPEQRYQQIMQTRPELIQRIPHHILATYLGITPVSLSRIRSRKKNKN